MDALRLIEALILITAALTVLIVALTLVTKALRALRVSWYRSQLAALEPELEEYLVTGGKAGAGLFALAMWRRDLLLSGMMVERLAMLRGGQRERLVWLAYELGLVDRYRRLLKARRRFRRARAAERLGHFGGDSEIEPLGELLSDEDETVRAVAARSLARIGVRRPLAYSPAASTTSRSSPVCGPPRTWRGWAGWR